MATILTTSNPLFWDSNPAGTNDFVLGSTIADLIYGLGGADHLYGGDGNDTIHGGLGNDTIGGDNGNDSLYGDLGSDVILGGDGNDVINGGHRFNDGYAAIDVSSDSLYGGLGDDSIYGGQGSDFLFGGDGNDFIQAGMRSGDDDWMVDLGNDTVEGGSGNDVVYAGGGNDSVSGGDDNDILFGQDGNDTLNGDGGDDTLHGGTGDDDLAGGTGFDTYHFGQNHGADTVTESTSGAVNTLLLGWSVASDEVYFTRAGSSSNGRDTSLSIQSSQGTIELVDVFTADGEISELNLSAFDLFEGGNVAAGDLLDNLALSTTGVGFERLRGTVNDDTLIARSGSDAIIYGGGGDDTYKLDAGFGVVRISEYGNETGNIIEFGAGISVANVTFEIKQTSYPTNDLVIKHGSDELTIFSYFQEESENPTLADIPFGGIQFADGTVIDLTSDRLDYYAEDHTDTLQGSSRGDILHALSGHDTVYAAGGDDIIYGGHGTDHLYGEAGNDEIYGGIGNEQIIGGKGDDILTGGDWADYFVFNEGDGHDTITDFEASNWAEAVDLSSYQSINGFNDFTFVTSAPTGDMEIGQDGGNTVIRIDANASITLEDVLSTDLSASEFIFA